MMMTTRPLTTILAGGVALVLLSSTAVGQPAADRDALELALSGHEQIPSKQALQRMGSGVEQRLREIVDKPSRRVLARSRAISMLRFFPSRATAATLRGVIQRNRKVTKPSLATVDLRAAITSYAVVVGPKALDLCEALLAHPLMDVRDAAVRAVRLTKSPRALPVLLQRRAAEPSPMVRHQLDRQIALLQGPPSAPPQP